MRNIRNKKKGFIYLLESADGLLLKFGASISPKDRVRHINSSYKNNKFTIFSLFRSEDIFDSECKIKWMLWDKHIAGSEIFLSSKIVDKKHLLHIAESVCGEGVSV